MTKATWSFGSLTDAQLLIEVHALAASERVATTTLIGALAELELRRLYLGQGYPSLFKYCTQALHLSGDAAYNRMRAAHVAAKWPLVLDLLADGSLTLASLRVLSGVLTDANHEELLQAARHKSRREVQVLVAPLKPAAGALPPSVISPVKEGVFYLQVPIDSTTCDELTRLQDLLRHQIPTGDPAPIVARAISHLLKEVSRQRWASTDAPRSTRDHSSTRYIPAYVRRKVWERDGGRCAFVGADGRCQERAFLEFHHVVRFTDGGQTTVENLQLRCRAHNAYEEEAWLGARPQARGAEVLP